MQPVPEFEFASVTPMAKGRAIAGSQVTAVHFLAVLEAGALQPAKLPEMPLPDRAQASIRSYVGKNASETGFAPLEESQRGIVARTSDNPVPHPLEISFGKAWPAADLVLVDRMHQGMGSQANPDTMPEANGAAEVHVANPMPEARDSKPQQLSHEQAASGGESADCCPMTPGAAAITHAASHPNERRSEALEGATAANGPASRRTGEDAMVRAAPPEPSVRSSIPYSSWGTPWAGPDMLHDTRRIHPGAIIDTAPSTDAPAPSTPSAQILPQQPPAGFLVAPTADDSPAPKALATSPEPPSDGAQSPAESTGSSDSTTTERFAARSDVAVGASAKPAETVTAPISPDQRKPFGSAPASPAPTHAPVPSGQAQPASPDTLGDTLPPNDRAPLPAAAAAAPLAIRGDDAPPVSGDVASRQLVKEEPARLPAGSGAAPARTGPVELPAPKPLSGVELPALPTVAPQGQLPRPAGTPTNSLVIETEAEVVIPDPNERAGPLGEDQPTQRNPPGPETRSGPIPPLGVAIAKTIETPDQMVTPIPESAPDFAVSTETLFSERISVGDALRTPQGTASHPPALAAHVGRQLAAQITALPDGPLEVALNPEELGRVRMSLSSTETGMTVTILVERADTAELLRRNLDQLSQEFRELGYRDVNVDLRNGREDAPHERGDQGNGDTEQGVVAEPWTPAPMNGSSLAGQADGRLDVKL